MIGLSLIHIYGVQPAYINGGAKGLDIVKIIAGSDKVETSEFLANTSHVSAGQGCIIDNAEDMAEKEQEDNGLASKLLGGASEIRHLIITEADDEVHSLGNMICDTIKAAIKPAHGWSAEIPCLLYTSGACKAKAMEIAIAGPATALA